MDPEPQRHTRKLVAHLIMTLDGVVHFDAVADRLKQLRNTEEVLGLFFSRVAEEDAMLLGRRTYHEWSVHWPRSSFEPFASHINEVPKFVVSSTLATAPWGNRAPATILGGDLREELLALKQTAGRNIGVHGSPTLVEGLLRMRLLDELRLEVYPLVAGTGQRLFGEGASIRDIATLSSTATSNGVVITSYRF